MMALATAAAPACRTTRVAAARSPAPSASVRIAPGQARAVCASPAAAPFSGAAAGLSASRAVASGSRREVTRMGLFGLGGPELLVIAGVAAVLFGPSKLPELGKGLGKTVKSFQGAAKEFEEELKNEMGDPKEEAKKEGGEGEATPPPTPPPSQ